MNKAYWNEPDVVDVDLFQPKVTTASVPVWQHTWNIPSCLSVSGLNSFVPLVPTIRGDAKLIASWNASSKTAPTVVMLHGGHGVSLTNFYNAQWLRSIGANVLLLDSYWSRGRNENWYTWNEFGANMRMLDALAASNWLTSMGYDARRTWLMGDSQGGWTVLRTFTGSHNFADAAKEAYAGGFALYPNCWSSDPGFRRLPTLASHPKFVPPLHSYVRPVTLFTGSLDTATSYLEAQDKTLTDVHAWYRFVATHAWDLPSVAEFPAELSPEASTASLNPFHASDFTSNRRVTASVRDIVARAIFD